jgi:hypothetical protein
LVSYISEFFGINIYTHMKLRYLPLVLIFCLSCGSDKENESENDSTLPDEVTDTISPETDSLINKLLGDGHQTIHGINLGDPLSKVSSTENWELFESTDTSLAYTWELSNDQLIDIYYTAEKGSFINNITVDLFLNSETGSDKVLQGLNHYFTLKYGKAQGTKEEPKWVIDEGDSLKVIRYHYKLDKGLRLEFFRSTY